MTKKEAIIDKLVEITPDLEITSLDKGITRFGGHPLVVIIDGQELSFWSEFVRVEKGNRRSLAFRVITRMDETDQQEKTTQQGIRSLLQEKPSTTRVVTLDHRSNLEREIEPGTRASGPTQSRDLLSTYKQLLSGEIDVLLTPIREGALGPDQEIGNVGPFTESDAKNDPDVWDIAEEIQVARLLHLAFSGTDTSAALNFLRNEITRKYNAFALPLARLLQAELKNMRLEELPNDLSKLGVDLSFFSEEEITREIDLGFGERRVDRVIAYPYPTEHGVIYASLFRVWNVQNDEFEVVRVLQTSAEIQDIDGLRIDSSCVDGVHSLDCHCDCKAQLEQALYEEGLDKGRKVVIIQMADHEGKGWGSVLKGTGTHRPVREINARSPESPVNHVDVAAQFYHALGVPPDNRNYAAAQAVTVFMGITHVKRLLMDNHDKVESLRAVGLTYDQKQPLYADPKRLTGEANRVNVAKKEGKVTGANGEPVLYEGEHR